MFFKVSVLEWFVSIVHKYQTKLASLLKYHLPRMQTSLGQFFQGKLVPKFGLIFLKIWNLSRRIHLESNTKTSCYLAKLPADFRFMCLSLFCIIVFSALLFLCIFDVYSCSSHPLYIGMLSPLCFCCCFVYSLYLTLIRCILLLLSHVKRLQLL